jgi:hypothetical protein
MDVEERATIRSNKPATACVKRAGHPWPAGTQPAGMVTRAKGDPVTAVWPADAKTLVAQTNGGGFTPPPPPGSNCNIGAAKYSLDIATKKLAYSQCKFVDWNTPLTTVSGNKTLTAAQVAKVDAAMDNVAITTETICGADKPLLTITVSSPSQGTKTFKDSFYSCDGNGPYVDNIDGVFGAFRDIVGE